MANINQIQLPDGSNYNLKDSVSGYASETYVDNAVAAIDKASVGLGNVDNTSDLNKPVSTAQQTALNAKANNSTIAPVEASTTASRRYEIGDQFILSGVLYTATAIIANSGTITVGTNCTASDTIVEQIANVSPSADNVSFDNAGTDLVSENVENAIKEVNANSAKSADLTSISESGTTASQAISAGTYFYLEGTLVRAKTDIASGATFTENTNYEVVSAGALNSRGIKLLWSNPNPSAAFPAQTITLSSSDYDLLLFTTSNASRVVLKGENCTLGRGDTVSSGTNLSAYSREIIYQNATTYSAGDGYYQVQGSTRYVYNLGMRPIAIYGIKL